MDVIIEVRYPQAYKWKHKQVTRINLESVQEIESFIKFLEHKVIEYKKVGR
jgi:hypothetical protein